MKDTTFDEGSILPNGAKVLRLKASRIAGWSVILAKYRGEYVTWNMDNETGECQSGAYFPDFDGMALADFHFRH